MLMTNHHLINYPHIFYDEGMRTRSLARKWIQILLRTQTSYTFSYRTDAFILISQLVYPLTRCLSSTRVSQTSLKISNILHQNCIISIETFSEVLALESAHSYLVAHCSLLFLSIRKSWSNFANLSSVFVWKTNF